MKPLTAILAAATLAALTLSTAASAGSVWDAIKAKLTPIVIIERR